MNLSLKILLNRIKNRSRKGSISAIKTFAGGFNTKIVKFLYKKGFIQSVFVSNYNSENFLYFIVISFRSLFEDSLLNNISFYSKGMSANLKVVDKMSAKKVVHVLSSSSGIVESSEVKKKRSGGFLLFSI